MIVWWGWIWLIGWNGFWVCGWWILWSLKLCCRVIICWFFLLWWSGGVWLWVFVIFFLWDWMCVIFVCYFWIKIVRSVVDLCCFCWLYVCNYYFYWCLIFFWSKFFGFIFCWWVVCGWVLWVVGGWGFLLLVLVVSGFIFGNLM